MEDRRSGRPASGSIVSELEGTLLKDVDPFPYFMLVAFETSGLVRFVVLLLLWPLLRLLDLFRLGQLGLRLMVFVAVAGVRESEIEAVARAVLPKFYVEDVDVAAWNAFSAFERRAVVTRCPTVMVERFAKDHLGAVEVVGCELEVSRSGYATGFLKKAEKSLADQVMAVRGKEKADVGLCTSASAQSFSFLCKVSWNSSFCGCIGTIHMILI